MPRKRMRFLRADVSIRLSGARISRYGLAAKLEPIVSRDIASSTMGFQASRSLRAPLFPESTQAW
jgi:hypothetical protein